MSRAVVDQAMQIEGMTSADALGLMDIFIKRAVAATGSRRFIEFGAYRGRTASLLAQNCAPGGALEIVDPADYLQIDAIKAIHSDTIWHREPSEKFCERLMKPAAEEACIAASHHDASHFFVNVRTELRYLATHADPGSVLMLDDFNDGYAQVRAAFYELRYAHGFPFEILVIGFNKCVLVHSERFRENEAYVLDKLLDTMENEYGFPCRLARTDNHPQSRGFFLTRRPAADKERYYGRAFFGDRFYKPTA